MNFANAIDFNLLMEPVAARLAGEPNKRLSKPPHDVRFGTHGSLSIDYAAGQFYDHEANVGGGVCDLVKHKMGVDHAGAIAWLRQQGFLPSPEPRLKVIRDTSYDYVDEDGILLSQVIRHEPKDFRQRRPDGPEGWIWNLEGARRVLYRLPDLIGASGKLIFITEGEKDCDNVRALGFTATTNMGGAGKWLPEYNEFLRGADVILLPHNDSAGRDHADKVATALNGIARRVRVLDIAKTWSECPGKGDISDWIEAGGTADRLKTMIGDLPDWEHAEQSRLRPLTAAEFLARELPPRKNILGAWLPEKGIVMVYSPRGVGKTLFGMTCAYAIAAGAGFLGFDVPEARKVLYLDAEMPAAAMQERLAAIVQGSEKQPPANDYFRILEWGFDRIWFARSRNPRRPSPD